MDGGEEIDAFFILLPLINSVIPKRISYRKLEIGPSHCINILHQYWTINVSLASRNVVGEIWEDAYKVSFADFWSSVDLPHFKNIKLYKATISIIIVTNKFDRIQETEKYQWKTLHKENFNSE